MATKPELFVRSKTGLVREMGVHDALVLNLVNISFFSSSIFVFQLAPVIFPGGNMAIGFGLCILFTAPMYLGYALLASSYPRSGGDYVFLSRLINPALAFVATFSAWVFWQWWYEGTFPLEIYWQSISPFLLKMAFYTGSRSLIDLSNTMSLPGPSVAYGIALIVIAFLFALPGLRFYVKVQRAMFVFALLAVGSITYDLLTITPASFASSFNAFVTVMTGQQKDWYNLVILTAHSTGYSTAVFSWGNTVGIVPVAILALGYGFWSIMLQGEIKQANMTKRQVYAIYGSVILTGLFFALVGLLVASVGGDFYGCLFYLYYNGNPLISQMMITPNYIGLAIIASHNVILDTLLELGSGLNVFNLMILMFVIGSRVMFAQSLDRVLPRKLSDLSERFVTPVKAMVLYLVASALWVIPATIYPSIYFYFTAVVLGVLLAYVLVGVAAVVFPYRGKAVYETMPFSKYKVGGIPLISIIGIVNLIFCAFLLYFYATVPALGLIAPTSLELVLAVYVFLGVYYYANRQYKKRTLGYDVELAFKEIPPE